MRKPFYGWIIVGVAFLIGVTESGAFQNMLSVMMKPMIAEFGWSRTAVTGSIAFGSICGGLLSPFVGPILDRQGPRMVAFWSILIMSAGLVCMTFVQRIWQLYLFFGMGRMIVVGVLNMVITITVANWFIRMRGRAMGITWLGPRFGSVFLPVFVQFIIFTFGWRMAWGGLGLIIFVMSGIPALLLLKRRPEDVGLLPDGAHLNSQTKLTDATTQEGQSESNEKNLDPLWTRAQALRTKAFWTLTGLHSIVPFVNGGLNFHLFPFLTDKGLNEMTAVFVLSTIAVFGAVGSIVWGFFAEKFRIQRLLSINVFGSGLIFLLLFLTVYLKSDHILRIVIIFVLAALYGILHGGRNPIMDTLWGHFFGRQSLGSIFGFASPFRFAANAIGPVFAAFCFDMFGSYTFPFYIFVGAFFLSGFISFFMEPPQLASRAK